MRNAAPFVFWLSGCLAALGQIEVSCRLDHTRVLQYEPILATVEVVNNTMQSLVLSDRRGNAALGFEIEQIPGVPIPTTGQGTGLASESIPPGGTLREKVNLLTGYVFQESGPYTIRARLDWGGKQFLSSKLFLDVAPGLIIGELTAGVPADPAATRTYTLRTLNRDQGERVFLRIDDEDAGRCYGVIDLGQIVRLVKPTMQVDGQGNIHVLHQAGPYQFTHSAFTPDGMRVGQDVYTSDGKSIQMGKAGGGTVAVEGGQLYRPEEAAGAPEEQEPTRVMSVPAKVWTAPPESAPKAEAAPFPAGADADLYQPVAR